MGISSFLSKDIGNPRWKPLHLAASWNAKSRRNAKKLSKTNWYKGKSEVDLSAAAPPVDNVEKEANPNHQEDVLNRKYDASNHQGVPQCGSDYDAPSNSQGRNSLQGEMKKRQNKNKKRRGADRENITLGGLKKVEIANKRRAMQL